MSSRRTSTTFSDPATPNTPTRVRTGIFHRESTRLRSNVADQVQRDLLPAGRMLSVFLILCELLAEVAVLIWSRGQACDRPLRFWVQTLMGIQAGAVVLNCLNIWQGRDTFGQHRNGLSSTENDMYTVTPAAPTRSTPDRPSTSFGASSTTPPNQPTRLSSRVPSAQTALSFSQGSPQLLPSSSARTTGNDSTSSVIFQVSPTTTVQSDGHSFSQTPSAYDPHSSLSPGSSNDLYSNAVTRPLVDSSPLESCPSNSGLTNVQHSNFCASSNTETATSELHSPQSPPVSGSSTERVALVQSADHPGLDHHDERDITHLSPSHSSVPLPSSGAFVSTEFVDRYVRIVNAWYLVWYILGSIWVSDGGTCSTTAPHLYRLIVALTIIYYALLFLPLACFCLIVCCLPLFILVYRIMLPYAERERRRARAADPSQVQNLNSIVYSPETFRSYTGSDNLDDASCVICLCDYEADEVVRFLPCKHHFHRDCVDVWLRLDKACCLCKQDIDAQTTPSPLSAV